MLRLLSGCRLLGFPASSSSLPPHRRPRHALSRHLLERLMVQRLTTLYPRNSSGSFSDELSRLAQKLKGGQGEGEQDQDWRQRVSGAASMATKLFVGTVLLAWLLQGTREQPGTNRRDGVRRIVSQAEMLALLGSGHFLPEVILQRQPIQEDFGGKKAFQTLCFAKEAGRAEPAAACVVNHLGSFLSSLEKIEPAVQPTFLYAAEESSSPGLGSWAGRLIVYGCLAAFLWWLRTSMKGASGGGLSDMLSMKKYEPIKPESIQTLFKDVAGLHEAKQEVTEFVDFLKNPDKYLEMGAKVPKGALLTGPPGTGKTLLARACAGEAGVPFFYVSGSEFVEKYVGLGANRVRSLFASAAKAAPSIIFIDQIDAIGKKRNSGPFSNEEKENTLNQLLVNMDGFDSRHKVIVMAATNLKESLDPALLRPGRFDRAIDIGLPNLEERQEILRVHLIKLTLPDLPLPELARKIALLTPGFSGAELANVCNEAAILAARLDRRTVELSDFEKATERVLAGLERRSLFSQEERESLAFYECGKAVVAWFTEGADPVIKISIAPYSKRGKGYSHQLQDEMPLRTEPQLRNRALTLLAGRASQQHFKGYLTNSSEDDLRSAKRILTFMVAKLGMSPRIGRLGFPDTEYTRKPYSDSTEQLIDQEVEILFRQCQQQAARQVAEKAPLIQKLAGLLLEKQTLTHAVLRQVLGDRPYQDNQNYMKFLRDSQPNGEQQGILTPPAPQ